MVFFAAITEKYVNILYIVRQVTYFETAASLRWEETIGRAGGHKTIDKSNSLVLKCVS